MGASRAALLLLGLTLVTACGSEPPTAPRPVPTPVPPPTTPPAPTPTATPTPEPTPTDNQPPSVSIEGGGACHPRRTFAGIVTPCEVTFTAVASDRDGDRLVYTWSGCASGEAATARCAVDAIRTFTAQVAVRDGRGGSAKATATAEGVNLPPVVRFGRPAPPDPAAANTIYSIAGGQPEDPEGDVEANELCRAGAPSVNASGPCRIGLGPCGGVGDAFDVDITTLAGPGHCVIEARVRDPWGAVGKDRLAFDVLAPR